MVTARKPKRRRKEAKTDYRKRMILLKADKPRIVIRRTNKYFIVQLVESSEAQDKVVKTLSSKVLLNHGWSKDSVGSLKSVPAGYLTGKIFAKELGDTECIIDLGMVKTIFGNRAFAVVKGLVDGGAKISANKKVFPSEERIKGEHLKDDMKAMISKVEASLK
jgi:large subunit ribosomal protein L18